MPVLEFYVCLLSLFFFFLNQYDLKQSVQRGSRIPKPVVFVQLFDHLI